MPTLGVTFLYRFSFVSERLKQCCFAEVYIVFSFKPDCVRPCSMIVHWPRKPRLTHTLPQPPPRPLRGELDMRRYLTNNCRKKGLLCYGAIVKQQGVSLFPIDFLPILCDTLLAFSRANFFEKLLSNGLTNVTLSNHMLDVGKVD